MQPDPKFPCDAVVQGLFARKCSLTPSFPLSANEGAESAGQDYREREVPESAISGLGPGEGDDDAQGRADEAKGQHQNPKEIP